MPREPFGILIVAFSNQPDAIAELQANRDPPKTLEELYQNEKGPGYQNHHIVERKSASRYGIPMFHRLTKFIFLR